MFRDIFKAIVILLRQLENPIFHISLSAGHLAHV